MRNLVASILITFILFFNCNSVFSFDFAPEVVEMAPNFQLKGFNKNIKSKKIWELNDIESFIEDLNNTESLIKKNPQISNQIINNMILNKVKNTNIQI